MELVCPLCNGLDKVHKICKICQEPMEDKGALVNYYDDYSPYLLDEITSKVDGVAQNQCLHHYRCEKCGYEENIAIDREIF